MLLARRLLAKRSLATSAPAAPPAPVEVELFVNGNSIKVAPGSTLIQACEKAGATIPRFCYHERLAVAGNCRMCLVEVEKSPKPVASCAFPVAAGMRVHTETPMVHKAREGVMEFLLSNHPLDCPICDQGGECDLQDQSVRYGSDRGRFREFEGKRSVEDKNFGPLVKTTMTRCIHCTRCVRFSNEIAGADELGTSGRGNDMQIGMYIERALNTEMSGNIIDLCPVGALTSKPYEFKARPWELRKTESIDVLDAIGSNIRVDSRGLEVLRVLPRVNEDINEEWINDKTRFACDGLKRQRLTVPMIRDAEGKFAAVPWKVALQAVTERLMNTPAEQICAVAGQLTDVETMVSVKDLFARMGSRNLRLDGEYLHSPPVHGVEFRSNYLLNSQVVGAEKADVILLIGTNPRHEGAIFNTRIRKNYLNGAEIGLVGELPRLNYEVDHLGNDLSALDKIEKSGFFAKFAKAKNPMVVIGSGVVEHAEAASVYKSIAEKLVKKIPALLTEEWNGISVLQRDASVAGALDVGFQPSTDSKPVAESKLVYLLGADRISESDIPKDAFVIYQGHHGDAGANFADVILPGCAYTEKNATYVNTEGRPQLTRKAIGSPGDARQDWKIVRALSEMVGQPLPYDEEQEIRDRLADIAPHFAQYGLTQPTAFAKQALDQVASKASKSKKSKPLSLPIKDFYLTDVISRNSVTMAKCSSLYTHGQQKELEQFSTRA